MSESLMLPGMEPAARAARATDRLFFAVFPDADAAERITALSAQLREAHGLRGKPHAPDRLHATLHFLGDHLGGLPQAEVDAACRAADSIAAAPFDVVFDRVESFQRKPRNRPFVMRGPDASLAALRGLRNRLGLALQRDGWILDAHFTPHVTLLYDDLAVPTQAVEPVRWTVREFVLVHSRIGCAQHIPLGRWPLVG